MATSIAIALPRPAIAAASGFTVAMLRQFVASTLPDEVLQTYLDAAMDAIDDVLGPATARQRINAVHGDRLPLAREADEIVTVVEDARGAGRTLAADDYELSDSGLMLYRLSTGTHPAHRWIGRIEVTYRRADDPAERIRVAVALVQLDLGHQPGLAAQSIGTWSETYRTDQDYTAQREALLGSLGSQMGLF